MGEVKKVLLGRTFIFSEQKDAFNTIRKKFIELSDEARILFNERYTNNITSISDYELMCDGIADKVYEQFLQLGVIELINNSIYDIDEVVLRAEIKEEFGCNYKGEISEFIKRIIELDAEKKMAQNENIDSAKVAAVETAQAAGSVFFGAPDIFQMGVAAAADGVLVFDTVMNIATATSVEAEKKRLINSEELKLDLMYAMKTDVENIHKSVARIVNERSESKKFVYPTDEDICNIEPICRNIIKGNYREIQSNPELEKDMIQKIVEINPYDKRMYCKIMKDYGGITEELRDFISYLAIDIASIADSFFDTKYDMDDFDTYEKMCDLVAILGDELVQFGIDSCLFYEKAEAKKQYLFDIKRTFNGYMYDTIEQRDFAEKQYNDFLAESIEEMDIEEALAKYESTFDPDMTEKNRQDLQTIVLVVIADRVKMFTEADSLKIYVDYAENKKKEHGLEKCQLLDTINKKYKALALKEKLKDNMLQAKNKVISAVSGLTGRVDDASNVATGAVDNVSGKASEVASGAMSKGKDLFGKIPFGKKNSEKVVESSVNEKNETKVPDEHTIETKNCPNCNNVVKISGKFCGKCGYRF